MLHLYCPYCGEHREESEFHYRGQAHIERPKNPEALSDEEWGNYVFFRKNPKGIHHELWYHVNGCRQFFNVSRDTVTYKIHESYKMGEQPAVMSEGDLA